MLESIIEMNAANHKPKAKSIAFTGVSVIPMDSERVLDSHTVVVHDGLISALGPADDVEVPAGADVVDGRGAYLIPGLANMHAHLIEYDPDPSHLGLYLAGGVCTVRSLNSQWEIFEWRDKVAQGDWIGPTILLSGPVIVGFPHEYRLLAFGLHTAIALGVVLFSVLIFGVVMGGLNLIAGADLAMRFARQWSLPWLFAGILGAILIVWRKIIPVTSLAARILPQAAIVETPAQARFQVRRQAKTGVDLVKLYDYLDRRTYFAGLDVAKEIDIYAAGHIPENPEFVRVDEALEAGLDEVVHVDEMTHEFLVGYKPNIHDWVEWDIALDRIDNVTSVVAEYHAAVTATLVTNETVLLGLENRKTLFKRSEYAYVKPKIIAKWDTGGRWVNWKGQENYRRDKLRPLWMQLTIDLHKKGVPILLGTDSSVQGIVPGFSEHRELELLVEAGLTPFEALSTGTRNAAMIANRMKADSNWGVISVGKRADLILLSKNPLIDISNTQNILGVTTRGRWFTKADLDELIAQYLNDS
jgi:hypothetical protein